jgi:hypothetical protein
MNIVDAIIIFKSSGCLDSRFCCGNVDIFVLSWFYNREICYENTRHPKRILRCVQPSFSTCKVADVFFLAISRYSIAVIVLSICVIVVIVAMSLVVDWHLAILIPAYAEYTWVGVAWCMELGGYFCPGLGLGVDIICTFHSHSNHHG